MPALDALLPGVPVVAEEAVARGAAPEVGERFWLVDPLDGTKEFVSRNGEFTVNIALIEDGVPVLGVVLAPALGRLFAGRGGRGRIRRRRRGAARRSLPAVPAEGLTVVASRSHGDAAALDAFLAGRKVASLASAGSSLKLCLVAAGEADLYPRLGRTMEWDIAAGHAVCWPRAARCVDSTASRCATASPASRTRTSMRRQAPFYERPANFSLRRSPWTPRDQPSSNELRVMDLMHAVAGFLVGMMVGMTGVGGGALMTPILVLLFGVAPATAVGTDLWFAALTKIVGGFMHNQRGSVDWQVLRRLCLGSLPTSIFDAGLAALFRPRAGQAGTDPDRAGLRARPDLGGDALSRRTRRPGARRCAPGTRSASSAPSPR